MSPQSSRVRSPADVGGPSTSPPPLPEGWLAQWEGTLRKWYFVQPATGKSQWDVPTEPFIPTPSSTPHSVASPGPYHAPRAASLAPSETEAVSKEFQELRSGKWASSGGFSNSTFGNNQPSPYQHASTPGAQRTPTLSGTPTLADQIYSSRPSSQGILGQVASDLATRANSTDMADVQKTNTPNQYTYPPSHHQIQGASSQLQDVTMGQDSSTSQNEIKGAGASFTPQQNNTPVYAMEHSQLPQGNPNPMSIQAIPPVIQPHGENLPSKVQPIGNSAMDPGFQYQQFPGKTPPAQQGMMPYPNQPHQQPDSYYQRDSIPIPSGQFPPRISPVSQPRETVITVIHPDPNAAPLFPTRYSDAERQRRQQAGMQAAYNNPTPPGQSYQTPHGSGYVHSNTPSQITPGYSHYDQYTPRSGQRQPNQGNGPPWDYDRSQVDPQGYPNHMRYTPPQQHQPQTQPHYRAESGGYSGGWGRS
ncbi:hypothetical protein LOZ52_004578 [Ophidiomyces ophidiicola]|nr:hypothetical protein LOZ52_004578 [Ophidiomyces ophidiicola]